MSTCPSCGDDANVQKVSGVYYEQTGSTLAGMLSPPHVIVREPGSDDVHRDEWAFTWRSLLLLVTVVPLGILVTGNGPIGVIVYLILFFPGLIWFVYLVAGMYAGRRHEQARRRAKLKAEEERQSPEHQKRRAQWEEAYYCRKHAAVILEDGKALSPAEFRSLMDGDG